MTTDVDEASASPEEAVAEDAADEVATQEVAPLKAALASTKPPAADVEEHNVTHTPCMSWCDSCVEGRGFGEQRGRHVGRAHGIPRVGVDYWFITTCNLELRKELADEYPSPGTATRHCRRPVESGRS